jgi:hypothetical protein
MSHDSEKVLERLAKTAMSAGVGALIGFFTGREGHKASSAGLGAIIGAAVVNLDVIFVSFLGLALFVVPLVLLIVGGFNGIRAHWIGLSEMAAVATVCGGVAGGFVKTDDSSRPMNALKGAGWGAGAVVLGAGLFFGLGALLAFFFSGSGSHSIGPIRPRH